MKEDLKQRKNRRKDRLSTNLKRLSEFNREYKKRYFYMIINNRKEGERLLGQNSIRFLLLSLQRSKFMSESLLDCLRSRKVSAAYLIARAHFEVTGLVAYFYKHLGDFYNNKITYEEMDKILRGLVLGGKKFPDKDKRKEVNVPDSINVLTLIGEADKLFNSMANEKKDIFINCYDFLSEFCHPNCLGLTLGSDYIDWNKCVFAKKQSFKNEDLGILLSYICISSSFFFAIYDKCFALVKDREKNDMPFLLRSLPSAIWTLLKYGLNLQRFVDVVRKY